MNNTERLQYSIDMHTRSNEILAMSQVELAGFGLMSDEVHTLALQYAEPNNIKHLFSSDTGKKWNWLHI